MVKVGILMAAMAGMGTATLRAECNPGTGASLAYTSGDPLVVLARELLERGELAEAESLLASASQPKDASAETARGEMQETIRRLRRDYSLTLDGLVEKLKQAIPDVTAADVERWRQERPGQMQFRQFDGKICYFNREPGLILRFCEEAKRRRDEYAAKHPTTAPASPTSQEKLHAHLKQVVEAAQRTGKVEVVPIRHRIEYKLTVRPNRPGAKAGSQVRCWLPFPQEYRQQKAVKLIRTSPAEHIIAPNGVDGPCIGGAAHRSVYLEQTIEDPAKPVVFAEEFEYVSYAYYPRLSESFAKPQAASIDPVYLAERPPHIVFTPELKSIVDRLVGDEKNPLARARRLFEFVSNEIPWCPEMEYAIIPSLTRKVLEARRGDCGVQSTLFITMCRYAGIPARWQSGWESKPDDSNMHDWSEIYIEPWGWLPVDASYGLQKSDDPDVRYFYLGHQDAYRMIVNLDYGAAFQPAKASMRSEPLDFQRGEVELDGRNLYFDNWTYDMKFDCTAAGE